MNKYSFYCIIIACIFILLSCGNTRYVERTVTDTITLRDTTIYVERDSSSILALLVCDSLGNVLVNKAEYFQGKYSRLLLSVADNTLHVQGVATPIVKIQVPERLIVVNEDVPVPAKIPWWKEMLMWVGVVCLLLLAGYIAKKMIIRRF